MQQRRPSQRGVSKVHLAIAVMLSGALWVVFAASFKAHEMIVGGCVLAVSAVFFRSLQRSETLELKIRFRDVVTLWRLPWYVVSDVWEIVVVLVKDFGGERSGSYYRVCGFSTAKDSPLMVARRVFATAYTGASPNFIPIGIDYKQSRMLFHQIKRTSVPRMTQELGAQPAQRDQS